MNGGASGGGIGKLGKRRNFQLPELLDSSEFPKCHCNALKDECCSICENRSIADGQAGSSTIGTVTNSRRNTPTSSPTPERWFIF